MTGIALHLLRHGAPVTPGLLMGRTDDVPTPAGIAACMAQAGALNIERIICSDLSRARAAAEAIGMARSLPVDVDPRWRELDFGAWDGLAASAVDPLALGRFWDDPDRHSPPGGERWSALVARVADALAELTAAPTLVLTHGGAMRAALCHLCGIPVAQGWAFALDYAALLSLEYWPGDPPAARITGLRA